MLVSIAIPFYNASKYILHTLDSIFYQHYSTIELLLYDDASIDDTNIVVEKWLSLNSQRFSNIYFTKSPVNRGASFAVSVLLKNANGKYFQMLGADDILLPQKITSQVEFLKNNLQYKMVYTNSYRIDEFGYRLDKNYFDYQMFNILKHEQIPSGCIYNYLIQENFIPASSFLAETDAIIMSGGYDELIRSEDWDMFLRFSNMFQIGYLDFIQLEYRIHGQSTMQNKSSLAEIFRSFIITLQKHIGYSPENDIILKKHICKYSIGMYRLGSIDLKYLFLNLKYNFTIKSLIYFFLGLFRIRINSIE